LNLSEFLQDHRFHRPGSERPRNLQSHFFPPKRSADEFVGDRDGDQNNDHPLDNFHAPIKIHFLTYPASD
jgi:hypothetical protein